MNKTLSNCLFFIGNKQCPICNNKFYTYISLPSIYKNNLTKYSFKYSLEDTETLNINQYTCPSCDCTDRDRLYKLFWEKKFQNINQNIKYTFIDFAPSKPLAEYLKNISILNYRSADLFMKGVDDKVDIQELPYADNSVDFFNCSHILEHVNSDIKSLNELYRILKPKGIGILMVPIFLTVETTIEDINEKNENIRWQKFGQDDHIRLYNKKDYMKRITDAGFILTFIDKNNEQSINYLKSGISEKFVLYIVSK